MKREEGGREKEKIEEEKEEDDAKIRTEGWTNDI